MWIVFESRDGSSTLLSEKFGVTYHSKYGAMQESKHVFLQEGLFFKCIEKKSLKVLEMGFGTGLNSLLTCLEANKLNLDVTYTTIDKYPIDQETLAKLNYCEVLGLSNGDCCFNQLHQANWGERLQVSPNFSFMKVLQPMEEVNYSSEFDIVYFDAFAPNVQPELWELPLMEKMHQALQPGGILVTYCAKGVFKRTLKSAGFKVETVKGPPGKREMVRAVKK